MTRPSKARIRQSFERAAPTYDSAASVQRRICHDLIDRLPALPVGRLLDAGCGTGYALPLLRQRFPEAQIVGLDLSPAMLHHVSTPCCRVAADLEHLPLATASIDLYWTSLAVQWCDLPAALGEARVPARRRPSGRCLPRHRRRAGSGAWPGGRRRGPARRRAAAMRS